jgi:putative ABC transport system permease protein
LRLSPTAALVAQRTPVLGTFIIAGASPLQVSRLVLVEAAVLGLVGGFIGTGLGMVMASFAVADAAVGLSLNYSIDFAPIGSVFSMRPELLLFPLLGNIAAVLSAVFPAWRLRRLDPLALQRVGIVDEGTNVSSLSIVAASGFALALVGAYALKTGTTYGSPLLCAAGTTTLVLSAILLTLPLVRAVWFALRSPVQRILQTAGWISIEQLNRNVERSLLTVAAIALCIGVVLAASTLPRSFRVSVAHWYAFYGDAVVTSRIHQGGWLSAAASDSFEKLIAETAGVERVETLRVLQGQEYHGDRIAVAALSNGYIERALENASAIAANDMGAAVAAIEHGAGAAISENMAVHYALSTGDALELETPTSHLSLPIVAVVADFVSDRGSVLLERGLVGEHWRDKLVNYFAVFLAPGTDVEAFRRAFGGAGGERAGSLTVLSMSSLLSQIDVAIAEAFADIAALQLLVIVITIAGIVDLAVSNVLDRRRLHAILRVAGTTDGGIVRLITCEGGMIGVSAGVLGVALGMLASWIWIRFTYPVLVGYVLRLDFAWTNAILCVAFATATALLAGGVTGYARLRESPIAAVRAE